MTRFANFTKKPFSTVEPIDWNDPGDFRSRSKGVAVKPKPKPTATASTARASASAAPAPAPVASAKPKAPVKSAAMIATEAYAERAAKVMNSTAAIGKKKAAAKLLGTTKATADEIITQLATVATDSARAQAEQAAMWKRATAKANRMAGFTDEHAASENAVLSGWAKAVAKVNQMNGHTS